MAHPSNNLVNVPHHPQESDGYCLPACVQMVLDYLGLPCAQDNPPIVFVQAGELPHWQDCISQHAIVVVGLDEQAVQILDPAADPSPISVSIGDFLLAWSELDYIYAVLVRPKPN